jgi:hypothetical protein
VKTVIYLIVIIGWSILQARRKAMREQKRKQALGEVPLVAERVQPLGAVNAEENRAPSAPDRSAYIPDRTTFIPDRATSISDRAAYASASEAQFFQDAQQDVPEQLKPMIEQARRKKQKKRDEKQAGNRLTSDEPIERIVPATSTIGMQNYEKVDAVQKRFALDRDSIRTYVITREVLGPPRSRKPHRPAMKDRE